MGNSTLVLASASPRRKDLLREHGVKFRSVPAGVPEVSPTHFTVGETVLLNAKRKSDEVARRHPRSIVVGVDTLVSLEGRMLGKPADIDEARQMLARLSGREHEVFTGVWIRTARVPRPFGFIEMSRVRFRRLNLAEIDRYVEEVGPLDKAGAYAAQQDPMRIIEAIEGSRSNVIGLPMERLKLALGAVARRTGARHERLPLTNPSGSPARRVR
jgi:septum formation protein